MVDVDHQVAGGQVGVGLDPLAAVVPAGAGLFRFAAHRGGELALGEHGQLQLRVLTPGAEGAHADEHGAPPGHLGTGKVQGGGDLSLAQQVQQVFGTDLAAAQHQNAVSCGEVVDHVGGGGVQGAAVGAQLLGPDLPQAFGRQQAAAGGQALQLAQGEIRQLFLQAALAEGELRKGAAQEAALHGRGDVLLQLPQKRAQGLPHPRAVADADQGVGREIVKGGGQLRVDGGHIAVRPGGGQALAELLGVGGGGGPQLLCALASDAGGSTLQPGGDVGAAAVGQHLPGGEDQGAAAVGGAALGGHVEPAQRVHLVVKELAAHRLVHAGGEYVQNAAPEGELAGALHLVGPGVAGGGELPGQFRGIVAAVGVQCDNGVSQHRPRDGPLDQGVHRGHRDLRAVHVVQSPQPAVLPVPAGGGGAQLPLPPGQNGDVLPGEQPQISGLAVRLPLVGAQHQQGTARGLPHRRGDLGPVDRAEASQLGGAIPVFHSLGQLPHLRQRQQKVDQILHAPSPPFR